MSEETKNTEKGGISVEIEHIFPIIKKWLYSEKEIFLREIVKGLEDEKYRITVTVDKAARTLTVSDNGIGMTEEEVRKYICQIALSGALDFIQKYEGQDGKSDPTKDGIIGHFGLGFYSAFMVSDTVDVITRSWQSDSAVKWVCTETGDYEITKDYYRAERGTDVVMHIMKDEDEFLEENRIREILDKYCSFMPVEIYLDVVKPEEEKKEDDKDEKAEDKTEPKPINDIHPLWLKNPSECTDEEYDEFYHKVFHDYREPLFHIHINADYPLNFRGILYFPRLAHEYDSLEGQVKLYYNQVFVADNIKEVIPEFLLMLKGVLDCPELPLNVSRSYLQNSGYVAKISAHIVKKVADKLTSMFNTERESYEKLWDDLKTFVEYGCMRDHKFYDRVKDTVLYKTTDGKYVTLPEYLEREKHENTVYYTADKTAQAQYISMFADEGIEVVVLDKLIDTQFINLLESENSGVKFVRIDADVAGALKADGTAEENAKLAELFRKVSGDKELKVKFELLKNEKIPAVLNISEQSRRMDDMMKMYRMAGNDAGDMNFPTDATLVVNANSPLIKHLESETDDVKGERIAKQIYTLALLSQRQLTADELKAFLADSFDMLETY